MVTRTAAERVGPELAQFLAPGLVHGLGNSLFAIQGHAQLIRGCESEVNRARGGILKAAENALHGLDVLRFVLGEAGERDLTAPGSTLHRLCDYLRVPLRDRGIRVVYGDESQETPIPVDGVGLCQCVVELVRRVCQVLPSSFAGQMHIVLAAQRRDAIVVALRLETGPSLLPFPVDLVRAIRSARPLLNCHGVKAEAGSGLEQLRLLVPAREGRSPAPAQLVAES